MQSATAAAHTHIPSTGSDTAAILATFSMGLVMRLRARLQRFGHVIIPGWKESRSLSWSVMNVRLKERGEVISGEVRQTLLTSCEGGDELSKQWLSVVLHAARTLGVKSADSLHLVDSKLLIARPGKGKQSVHWDAGRVFASWGKYTVILVCAHGCSSTALPLFPASNEFSFSDDAATMAAHAHLLQEERYESVPASAGDLIFFRQSTPHFGVQNTMMESNRVVLFGMLSESPEPNQDALQVFPWIYTGQAFGYSSREFAECLVAEAAQHPVQRIKNDEGAAASQSAVDCLRKFGLLDAYTRRR